MAAGKFLDAIDADQTFDKDSEQLDEEAEFLD